MVGHPHASKQSNAHLQTNARARARTHTHITTTLEQSFRWEPSHIRPANVCMCAMCKCASVRESLRRLIDAIERPGFSVHEVGLGFRV